MDPPAHALPEAERRVVPGLAIAIVLFHLVFATRYGWFRDELYYVACGNRLAWGYVDHPPLVAIGARLATVLFGDSLVGLRLLVALAAGGTILLTAALARSWGGGGTAQILAALATMIAPYDLVVGHVYTMNGFEPLFWGGIALAVSRAIRDDDARPLLWLGPIVGFGILNKHSTSWPVVALGLGLLLSPARKLFARRPTWIAAAIAIAIVAPHVVWQVTNGFPTREFARAALSGKNEPYGVGGLVGQLLQLEHPLLAPFWIAGWIGLARGASLRPFRPFAIALLLLVLLVFVTQAKVYYLGPAWPWLFAAGGVVVERAIGSLRRRRLVFAYAGLTIAAALVLLPAAVPVLDVPTFQRYARALGALGEQRTGERMKPAALPQLYADMHGWPELAALVRSVVDGLPAAERAGAIILASNYGEASAIEHFGSGGPPVASGDNGWWLWGPPRTSPSVVVWVGGREELLHDLFAEVVEAGRFDHPLARGDEQGRPVYVARQPRTSLVDAWPRLKHYR